MELKRCNKSVPWDEERICEAAMGGEGGECAPALKRGVGRGSEAAMGGGVGAQRPVVHGYEPKKTGARALSAAKTH